MRTRAVPVTLVLVLALGACGSDDEPSDTPAGSSAASSAASSEDSAAAPSATTPDVSAVPAASSPADDAAPEAIDACALLPPDAVAAVVSVPVGAGVASEAVPDLAISDCTFEYEAGGIVQVTALVWPSEDEAASVFDFAVDSNDYPLVDGIGDEAYDAAPGFGLTSRVGIVELSVNVIGSEDAATELEQEKALALVAIGNLP